MKISYDRAEDILTIELDASAPIDHAEHTGAVIVHLSQEDRPIVLEILQASEFVTGLVRASVRSEPVTV
jgi:uncharacterized protein YuzE